MKSVDFEYANVIRLTAVELQRCACPCEKAGHQGACRIWMWPGQTYFLAQAGPPARHRRVPLCEECMEVLRKAGLQVGPGFA